MNCPIPISQYSQILLAHGGGGKLTQELVDKLFRPAFHNPALAAGHDGALITLPQQRMAFTTDSYVIHPLFFPGGDIGSLSVYGTVNDLAMCGAKPLYLSAGFILEEGLMMETLWKVVLSMKDACERVGVQLVTGDTKVVNQGKGDGIFINTAGVGIMEHDEMIGPDQILPGDCILINGDIGRHGMAVMAEREGLQFESSIQSDAAPLHGLVQDLIQAGIEIHCLRDLTRGGLGGAVHELAQTRGLEFYLEQKNILVRQDVQGACEILGLEPLQVANEGRLIVIVPEKDKDRAVSVMQKNEMGTEARMIGHVTQGEKPRVLISSLIGTTRILDRPSGEPLPRIC